MCLRVNRNDSMVMFHTFWHVIMHIPVELCIILSVCKDCLIDMSYTVNSSLVVCYSNVDFANKISPVLLVLVFDNLILLIHFSKPLHNFLFIKAKCESWRCTQIILLECKRVQIKHGCCRSPTGIKVLSHEALNFWDNRLDSCIMEVGVVNYIGYHVSLLLATKTISLVVEFSKLCCISLFKLSTFYRIGFNGCWPFTHESCIEFSESICPTVDPLIIIKNNKSFIRLGWTISNDVNMLNNSVRSDNFLVTNYSSTINHFTNFMCTSCTCNNRKQGFHRSKIHK